MFAGYILSPLCVLWGSSAGNLSFLSRKRQSIGGIKPLEESIQFNKGYPSINKKGKLWKNPIESFKGENMSKYLYSIASLFTLILCYSIFIFLDPKTVNLLQREDGFYQNLGALSLLFASVVSILCYYFDTEGNELGLLKTRKNIFYLFLGGLFFFGFGEEISWGQRIFGWTTPGFMIGDGSHFYHNLQKETNFHNLAIFHGVDSHHHRKSFLGLLFNMDRLFSLFWLSYFIIFPVLYKENLRFAHFIGKINLPIIQLRTGIFFILSYIISSMLDHMGFKSVELKETNIELLLSIVSIYFLNLVLSERREVEIVSVPIPLEKSHQTAR